MFVEREWFICKNCKEIVKIADFKYDSYTYFFELKTKELCQKCLEKENKRNV